MLPIAVGDAQVRRRADALDARRGGRAGSLRAACRARRRRSAAFGPISAARVAA